MNVQRLPSQRGIQQAKNERAAQEARLKETYNKASCLLKGLAELRDMPGSKFEFNVLAARAGDYLRISTNVPVVDAYAFVDRTITIHVPTNGRVFAYGDRFGGDSKVRRIRAFPRKNATKKVLEFTALRAARRGLIS